MRPTTEHISFLDYLRGLAILSVFLCHAVFDNYWPFQVDKSVYIGSIFDYSKFWNEGFLLATGGVAIFFVVSGFCVHLSHIRARDLDLGVFFLRRFFRIYPPYLVALLLFTFVYPTTRLDFSSTLMHSRPQYVFSTLQLLAHMALIHNLSVLTLWNINGVFWSIGIECQLYVLYPILLIVAHRVGWVGVLWMTAAIELGLRAYSVWLGFDAIWLSKHDPTWLTKEPLFFWFSWAIGAALADAYVKGTPLPFQGVPLYIYPLLSILSGQVKQLTPFTFPLIALATVYYISHWLRNPNRAPSAANQGIFFTHVSAAGVISYSYYLLHGPLLSSWKDGFDILLGHPAPFVMTLLCLPAWFLILLPSYLFYRFLEQPSIAWGKRLIEMRRQKKRPLPVEPVIAGS